MGRQQNEKIRVLLVEDEPAEAALIQRLLRSCSDGLFDVSHVENVKQTLHELKSTNFHIILLDLHLPDSTPMETIVLSSGGRVRNIPVVILSGRFDLKELAQDMNIPYFLTKGEFDAAQLCRTMYKAITDMGSKTEQSSHHSSSPHRGKTPHRGSCFTGKTTRTSNPETSITPSQPQHSS